MCGVSQKSANKKKSFIQLWSVRHIAKGECVSSSKVGGEAINGAFIFNYSL